jgi:hypothetical protein
MKTISKLILILFIILVNLHFSNAQCNDVILYTQAEVDAWGAANPTCTTVDKLWIKPAPSSILTPNISTSS